MAEKGSMEKERKMLNAVVLMGDEAERTPSTDGHLKDEMILPYSWLE